MKKIATIFLIIISASSLQAKQDSLKISTEQSYKFKYKNIVSVDLLGQCFLYSFNYERILLNKNNIKLSAETGLSYIPIFNYSEGIINKFSLNGILRLSDADYLEIGVGSTSFISSKDFEFPISSNFKLGARFQEPNNHIVFKTYFCQIINISKYGNGEAYYQFIPWLGATLGYTF
ncbi:MAG: hypothetical protein RL708_373 [Bacteroidota bacterium]|jgi:hypothetical protein